MLDMQSPANMSSLLLWYHALAMTANVEGAMRSSRSSFAYDPWNDWLQRQDLVMSQRWVKGVLHDQPPQRPRRQLELNACVGTEGHAYSACVRNQFARDQ